MDSFEFNNNIETEKSQAMRNYNRQKLFKNLEVFTALALIAWSFYNYIPLAADFLPQNVSFSGQPLYVFLAINTLIVVISFLSSQKPTEQDFYDDYLTISTNNNPRRSSTAAPEVTVSEKQIVCLVNVVNSPADDQQNTVSATKTINNNNDTTVVNDCDAVKEYMRSRSERVDRKGNEGEVMMMRRSETLIKRSIEVDKMDDLSSEEFRITIESFIAAKKKTLIRENSLDLNKL